MSQQDRSQEHVDGAILGDRSLGRRPFLKLGAAGAAGLWGTSLLAACSGSREPEASDAETQRGGTLRIALSSAAPTDSLDASTVITNFGAQSAALLYGTLVRVDLQWGLRPWLASEWSSSDDVREWKFRIRDGVEFHDGRPMRASDVAYSIRRILDPDVGSQGRGNLAPFVEPGGITAPDDTTVVFQLIQPNAFLPIALAQPFFSVVPEGTEDFSAGIGTGAFKLVRFEGGSNAEFERNENFWSDGRPYLDGVTLVHIAEKSSVMQSIVSGDADLSDELGLTDIETLENADGVEPVLFPNGAWTNLAANAQREPFTDINVLNALKYAQDRERLLQAFTAGYGQVAADVPIAPTDPFYPEDLEPRPFDPERARSLLADAGYPNGIDLVLFAYEGDKQDFAVAYRDVAQESGIRIEVQTVPQDMYWDQIWLQEPFVTDTWASYHISTLFPQAYMSGAPWNESGLANERVDQLALDAVSTSDFERQKELYGEALKIIDAESGIVSPGFWPLTFGKKTRVQGLEFNPNYYYYHDDVYLSE